MKTAKMSQDDKVKYMISEPIPKLICEMSVPTIISMLITSLYNMADTAFVGQINTQSTGAVGVSFSIMALIQAIGFFFGHGSGNYMSRSMGARQYEDAEKMSATGFFSALIVGSIVAILGLIFVEPIAIILGSTKTILPYAVSYLRIIFVGAPFIMGAFVINNQLRFQGSASLAMVGIVSGAILNVVLDPIFIFVCDLGVAGAALATVVSQMVSFGVLCYMDKTRATIKINIKNFTPNSYYYKNIFKGGIPSLCRQGIGSVATLCLNHSARIYGAESADVVIAALSIVNRISMFINSALIGFGQGFQPVCGTNYGAKKYARVREAFYFSVKVGAVVLLCLSVLGIIFASPLIHLFQKDEAVIPIGTFTLRLHLIFFTLNSWTIMCNMLLQTIGMAFKASIVALARQGLFFIPLVFILPLIFGLNGVLMAQMVADIGSFILAVPLGLSVLKVLKEDN